MYSIFQDDKLQKQQQERGIISFELIDWSKFCNFNKRNNFAKYTGLPQQVLKTLPVDRLKDMQISHYDKMFELEKTRNFLFREEHSDKIFAMERRNRGSDNSFQVDHLIKMTKSNSDRKILYGTPVFVENVTLRRNHLTLEKKLMF